MLCGNTSGLKVPLHKLANLIELVGSRPEADAVILRQGEDFLQEIRFS